MRWSFLVLAIFVLSLTEVSSHSKEPIKSDAKTTAERFYKLYLKINPRGLPTEDEMKEFAPLFSQELNTLIDKARSEQQRFIKEHPDEKPPWIEGNLFASLYEGAHSFTLGAPAYSADKASFPVYLEYREGKEVSKWIDVITLEKVNNQWLVWDIFLNGPWDFRSGPSLRAGLSAE